MYKYEFCFDLRHFQESFFNVPQCIHDPIKNKFSKEQMFCFYDFQKVTIHHLVIFSGYFYFEI